MISQSNSDYYSGYPNFSIFLPGKCNASCWFCYNNHDSITVDKDVYLGNLETIISELPEFCIQVSITGYEPTLSPYFKDVLDLLSGDKFKKVVLNTNGTDIFKYTKQILAVVDFINLSRHHFMTSLNNKIFGGDYHLDTRDVYAICNSFDNVTLTAVITNNTTKPFIDNYVSYARNMEALSVTFRQLAGEVKFLPVVDKYEARCTYSDPFCAYKVSEINEMGVIFKSSILNPGMTCNKIYEYIYKPDGQLHTMW